MMVGTVQMSGGKILTVCEFLGMSANPKSAFFIVAHARGKIMMNGQILLASSSSQTNMFEALKGLRRNNK